MIPFVGRLVGAAAAVPAGMLSATAETLGAPPRRRSSRSGNRYWIEVRGLTADTETTLGPALLEAVRDQPGVRSARLNSAVARIVVIVEPGGPTMAALCAVIADVEDRHAVTSATGTVTELPGDGVELGARVLSTAANGIGMCAAAAGRVLLWPRLPAALNAAVTTVDYQPMLRGVVERRLGANATDTAFALASAAVYTLTQAPASLAVETARHLAQAGELAASGRAWQRMEPALADRAEHTGAVEAPPRPCPMPPGPVERHARRSGTAQLIATPLLGLLAGAGTAATATLVAAPKAARNAREGFATTLSRGLADRHDAIALRPRALRRMDRIDAVVVDPRVLLTDALRVDRIRTDAAGHHEPIWRWAQDQVLSGGLGAGWHKVPPLSEHVGNGHSRAQVFVGHVHDPLAAAVVGEIRRGDIEVVSVATDELGDLRPSFDELHPTGASIDSALRDAVVRLQSDGRTVAVLSTHAAEALLAADLGIGVTGRPGPAPWHADLMVTDLAAAWRIMHALPAARRASQRGVELSTSATLLGSLLMIPGVAGLGPGPVTAGGAAGLVTGLWLARTALGDPVPEPAPTFEWHAMTAEQVRERLPRPERVVAQPRSRLAATAGTSAAVVNSVAAPPIRLAAELAAAVRSELSDPLTPVLAVGSAASALLGSPIDAMLVGSVLTGNAVLAASQQVRAERLLRRLLAREVPPARRLADENPGGKAGHFETVDAAALLPGDVIEVRSGEVIPADCRLISSTDLEVDESALTGESLPVSKQVEMTPGASVAERRCIIYATTTVVAGTGIGIVTTVGSQTQAERAADVAPTTGSTVGLQAQLRELTNRALPISLAGGALVSGLGLLRLAPLRQAVASGVAVAVAAVPEGLPLVATLAQQASARRLSGVGALVRLPKSIEALGRVDVVCFDKTGTLSENRLRVSKVRSTNGFTDEQVLAIAARATPPKNGSRHEHATDAAIVEAAGRSAEPAADMHLPFRSGRPFSASLYGDELVVKGAPEVIAAACAPGAPVPDAAVADMAGAGLRVIAVARRHLTAGQIASVRDGDRDGDGAMADLCTSGLQAAGLLGIADTPREASAGLLKALQEQGIGVRLVTGDHPVTAAAIATELGLAVTADHVISGTEWETLPRRAQERAVRDKIVFARMTPEHKVQVVQTLERTGLVCAMVGDGANDAAAIRAATVGIGVAARGSDPARTAADMMLLDGRIGALLDAIDEGRQLWRRVQAAVAVLLGGNAGEVAFAIVGSALTGRSPLNTRQLLLVNMMTDALPAAALAVSPATGGTASAGHGPDQAALWRTVAIRGTTTAAAATTAWLTAGFTLMPRRASTVALVSLVSTQLGQTLIDSHSPLVVATAAGSLVTLGALISTPGVSQLLGCTPLGPVGWTQALGTAAVATTAAAVAPRVLGRIQSSMTSRPSRQSAAYISRSGIVKAWEMTATGSTDGVDEVVDTSTTVRMSGVQEANSP